MSEVIEFDLVGKDDVSPVLATIASSFDGLAGALDALAQTSTSVGDRMAEAFQAADTGISALAAAMDVTDGTVRNLAGTFDGFINAVERVQEALTAGGTGAITFAQDLDSLAALTQRNAQAFADGAAKIAEYTDADLAAAGVTNDLSAAITKQMDRLDALRDAALGAIQQTDEMVAADNAVVKGSAAVSDSLALAQVAWQDTVTAVDVAKEALIEVGQGAVTTSDQMQAMGDVVKSAMDAVRAATDAGIAALGSELVTAADAGTAAIDTLATRLDAAARNLGVDSAEFKALAVSIQAGSEQMAVAQGAMTIINDRLATMRQAMASTSAGVQGLMKSVSDNTIALAANSKALADDLGITEQSAGVFARMLAVRDQLNAAITATTARLDAETGALRNDATAADAAAAGLSRAAVAQGTLGTKTAATTGGLGNFIGKVGSGLSSLADNALSLGFNAFMLDQFGYSAIKSGINFQQQMNINKTLAANTSDNIGQMTQTLISSAGVWGRTPLELAQGLYIAMSDGYHAGKAIDVLHQAALAGAGGLGKFSDIVRGVTTIMNDFGVSSSDAANMVLRTVTAGRMTLEEFVTNIGKVAPFAARAGYSLEAYAVSLDAMTRSGIPATQSATYLRSVMMTLGGHEMHVADAAAKMGISLSGATLETIKTTHGARGLADQISYITDATHKWAYSNFKGADAAAHFQDAMLTLTGGIRSGAGAASISARGFQNFNDVLKQMDSSTVNAKDHASQMFSTLPGSILLVKGALGGLQAAFVQAVGPYLIDLLHRLAYGMALLTEKLQSMSPATIQNIAKGFLAFVAIVNGVALASIGALGLKYSGVLGVLKLFGGEAGKLGTIFGHFGPQMIGPLMEGETRSHGLLDALYKLGAGAVKAGQDLGKLIPKALESGFKTFAKVAGEAVFQIGYAFQHFGTVMGAALDFASGKLQMLTKVGPALLGGLERLHNFLGDGLLPMILRFGESLTHLSTYTGLIRGALGGLWAVFSGGLPALLGLAGGFVAIIGPILLIVGIIAIVILAFTRFRTQTMAALRPLITEVGSVFRAIAGLVMLAILQITKTWQQVWPQIQPAMTQLLSAFGKLGPLWTILGTIIKVVAAIIIGAIAGLANGFIHALPFIINFVTAVIQIISGLAELVMAIFHGQWGKIPGIVGGIFMALLHAVGSAAAAILSFVGGLVNGIFNWFNRLTGGALTPIAQFVKGVIDFFLHLWHSIVGGSIIPDLINGIVRWFLSLPGKVFGMLAGFISGIIGFFLQLPARALGAVSQMVAGVGARIRGMVANVPVVGGIVAGIGTAFAGVGKLVSVAQTAAHGVTTGLRTGLSLAKSAVGGIIDQMVTHSRDKMAIMRDQAKIAADQTKVAVITAHQQEVVQVLHHLENEKQQTIAKIQQTKDPVIKAHLEMKLRSIEHAEQQSRAVIAHMQRQKEQVIAHAMKMAADAQAHAARMKQGVLANVGDMVGQTIGRFGQMVGQVAGNMGRFASSVLSGAQSGMRGMLSSVGSGIGTVLGLFGSLPGRIAGALGGLAGQLGGIAANAMNSMGNAIRNAAGRLADAAKNAVGSIINGAKSALGIGSPSTVFLEIGHNTVLGLTHGLTGKQGELHKVGQTVFGTLVKAATSAATVPVRAGVAGATSGATLSTGGGRGGLGGGDIHVHLEGGLGAGLALLNASDRRRLALQIGEELSRDVALQGKQPIGYSGKGSI